MKFAALIGYGFLLGWAIDAALVWAFLTLTGQDFEWKAVGIWLLVIWAVSFALWVRKTVYAEVWWRLGARANLVKAYVEFLQRNNFPPHHGYGDVMSWFEELAMDEHQDTNLRLAAQKAISEYIGLKQAGVLGAWRMASALKTAVGHYSKSLKAPWYSPH